jgi:hypothetical protein
MPKKEKSLEEQLKEAREEIKILNNQLKCSSPAKLDTWISTWFGNKKNISYRKEIFLTYMDYKVYEMPNREKSIFHETLKGFEEFSKLKGYYVFLSIDTSLDNKIAFKFDLPDGSSKWSISKIKDDLDEYLNRVTENKGIDDVIVKCKKLQESQIKSTLKNRMLLIQHDYNSQKNVFAHELKKKDSEIQCSKKTISDLEKQLRNLENEKDSSEEEKAILEIELSNKRLECEMLINSTIDKDNVIEHLKDIVIRSISYDRKTININGGINMSNHPEMEERGSSPLLAFVPNLVYMHL